MKIFLVFALISFFCCTELQAQFSRYIVQLKHKGATTHTFADPSPYLSQRAIDRRTRYGIALDSTDLPVPISYIQQITAIPNVTVLNVSRWLNAVSIQTTDAGALSAINALPFVQSTSSAAARPANYVQGKFPAEGKPLPPTAAKTEGINTDYYNYGSGSFAEIHVHNGEFLHNIGMRGQGMRIAMLDGGFFDYPSLDAFDSVNVNGQVLNTWDFVSRDATVSDDHPHGMQCFSIIAANIPGQFIGKAPKANFYLFRTEDVSSEFPIEEFNWACGAERADSSGADVISSSLGYGYQFSSPVADYPYSDLNGDVTMSARAADFAAKKGLMVFNSAGNSGTDFWHMITTPADGDSVVAVGSVNTSGVVANNSSYGPSADGRIKPDVASVGVNAMVQLTNNTIGVGSGTSFACPNMAGLGTCLWQGFPEFNNMKVVQALKQAGNISASPDDRIGYGIPDLKKAFGILLKEFAFSSATINDCNVMVSWTSKDVSSMKYEIERKVNGEPAFTKVGEVNPANGTILTNHDYQFTNILSNVTLGDVAYRIRQIIDTTSASFAEVYIDTVVVIATNSCTTTDTNEPNASSTKITIAPNPSTGTPALLIVETNDAIPNLSIALYDMTGRLVLQLQRSKPAGKAIFEIPVDNLAKGKYIIKVNNGRKTLGKTALLKL